MPAARAGRPDGVLVIGVGNALRHDDGAGLEVAARLSPLIGGSPITVAVHEGEPLGLLELWAGAGAVVLVDALRSGAAPGTIRRVDVTAQPVPAGMYGRTSTHAVGVGEAIELARALRRLPTQVVLFGVEGVCFIAGSGLSSEVEAVIPALAEAVLAEARALTRRSHARSAEA